MDAERLLELIEEAAEEGCYFGMVELGRPYDCIHIDGRVDLEKLAQLIAKEVTSPRVAT